MPLPPFVLLLFLLSSADVDEEAISKSLALPKLQERVAALRRLTPTSRAAQERIHLELAGQYLIAGDYEKAESEARAVESSQNPTTRARSLNVLGTASLYRANYAKALEMYRQALPISDDAARITILNNAGNANYYLGDYGEAWKQYAEAEAILARFDGPSKQEELFTTAVNQATILQRLGKDREAMQAYRDLESKAAPNDYIGRGQLLANLGAVYRRLGDPYKALETYKAALAAFEKAQYSDGTSGAWINIGIAYLAEMRDYPAARRAFEQALKTVNGREHLQARLYLAETARREGGLSQARDIFSTVLAEARSMQASEEIWKAEFGMGRSAPSPAEARRHFKAALDQIESIRANVRRGSQRRDFLSDKREVYDAYLATLTEPAEIFEWIERSRARLLQDDIPLKPLRQVQQQLAPGETLLVTSSGARSVLLLFVRRDQVSVRRIADAERELAAAVEQGIGADPRLIVVPDRKLAAIPWDALRLPAANRLLVEQAAVSHLPAGSLLRARTAKSPVRFPWQPSVLAVAVPSAGSTAIDRGLPPLAEAVRETEIVTASFPGRSQAAVNPTKPELIGRLSRYPFLHFAGHAIVDPRDSSRTRLVLESGAIYLSDLDGLDLSGLQLATLSACQTATGEEIAGEGVDSLSNAFLRGGARSVVAALSPVNDQASVEFIRGFYHFVAQGQSPAIALREAKLRFLRAGGHLAKPEHWASYVLYGDGDAPVIAGAFAQSLFWGLVAAAGVLAAAATMKRLTSRRS